MLCSSVVLQCGMLVVVLCEGATSFVGVENSPLTSPGGLTSLDSLGKSALEQSLSSSASTVQWTSRQQLVYVTRPPVCCLVLYIATNTTGMRTTTATASVNLCSVIL